MKAGARVRTDLRSPVHPSVDTVGTAVVWVMSLYSLMPLVLVSPVAACLK